MECWISCFHLVETLEEKQGQIAKSKYVMKANDFIAVIEQCYVNKMNCMSLVKLDRKKFL